MNYDVDALGTL